MTHALNIDLHTHSSCSDGSLTPLELVTLAAAAGVEVLALTDHDTVAGVDEALEAAVRHGIKLVPGVEISASWRAQAIHVLGLWIDPVSPLLCDRLESQAALRRTRMRRICARLDQLKLPGKELLAAVELEPGLPSRTHLAKALVAGARPRKSDSAWDVPERPRRRRR